MPRQHLRAVASSYDPDEATAAQQWLAGADDAWLACRHNHNFPKLRLANGKLPRGITARRQPDRSYAIRERCPDCGTIRTYTTIPGGWLGTTSHYTYEWPDGYRMPPGASQHVSGYDCKAEVWRRVTEELDVQADRDEAAAKRRRKGK